MAEVLFTDARPGVLTPRLRALLADAADAAGLPSLTVVKGSWAPADSASAGTHSGGGAADIGRMWDIGGWDAQDRLAGLLRDRGCAAWVRDQQHGGMDPHIHLIATGEANPHPEAVWQLAEYAAGRNGLASRGPDYHSHRPPLTVWEWDEDVMELTDRVELTESTRVALGTADTALTVGGLLQRAALSASALTVAKRNEVQIAAARAEIAALRAAIEAAGPGVDMGAISAAASDAVAAALADLKLTIE